MEALARFVEYYNHERLHEAIPQMGARTPSLRKSAQRSPKI